MTIEINVEIPQREIIDSTVTINARPIITDVTASVDNNEGTPYVDVTLTGTETERSFDLAFHNLKGNTGEKGDKGDTGAQGPQGETGPANTLTIGTVESGEEAGATITGQSPNQVLSLVLPKGDKGDTGSQGAQGEAATIEVGTVTTVGYDQPATVTNVGTEEEAIFNFEIPRGVPGSSAGIEAGAAIDVTGDVISVKYDNNTLKVNASNQLYAANAGNVDDVKVNGTSVVTNKVANIDLTGKQDVTDNTLTTTDKTIVGAINEINAKPSMPELDEVTITTNTSDELQAIGVIDSRDNSTPLKYWTGTKAQYDAITTKDSNTLYNITDDTDVTLTLLNALYPVGAIYIGTMATCPLQVLGIGTWQLKASDRVLQGAGSRGGVGDTLSESLPNITGEWGSTSTRLHEKEIQTGAFSGTDSRTTQYYMGRTENTASTIGWGASFDASLSSSIYQDNAPVQQNAYLVNIWERIS